MQLWHRSLQQYGLRVHRPSHLQLQPGRRSKLFPFKAIRAEANFNASLNVSVNVKVDVTATVDVQKRDYGRLL